MKKSKLNVRRAVALVALGLALVYIFTTEGFRKLWLLWPSA